MPNVRIPEREERRLPRQCNSQKWKFIADSSQGSCRNQRSGAGSQSPAPTLLPKFTEYAEAVGSWLKRIGYMFQSNLIGPNLRGLFSNLGVRGLFSFPLIGSLFLTKHMLTGRLQVA